MASSPPSFRGDWITPDHPEYPKAIARWAINAERRAAAVAFVKDPEDVSLRIRNLFSREGIVIDLSRHLAGVRVDPEKRLAYVGGGALWELWTKQVSNMASQQSRARSIMYVGNACQLSYSNTRFGTDWGWGLTLGGGYGFLSGQHGLVLDNLVQATLVTADQKIRTVNAEENADLYWAIRGAGSNFGVVTEFVFQLHPQRRTVFAGIAVYPVSTLTQVMSTITAWWDGGLDEREVVFQFLTKDPDGNPAMMLFFFWNGSEKEGRAHFKEFFDIGPSADHCREIPYEALNAMQANFLDLAHGRNCYMSGAFMTRPDHNLATTALDQVNKIASDVTTAALLEYIPVAKILQVPNTATAHIRGQRISCVVLGMWDGGKERLPEIKSGVGKVVDLLLQSSDKYLPRAVNTGYGNYIGEEILPNAALEPRISAPTIFGENYARLRELKKIYDPGMVFSKWCPIVPAV
ncbi:hypothetical protein BD779DRAFT_1674301 [Infundibulicybe gibba]|nr:hypothetical protein BD779DRAFT_1674301 [Infundibulicybe gibba]